MKKFITITIVAAALAFAAAASAHATSEDNYAEVRAYLKKYKGPLWHTRGPIRRQYMDKRAPDTAVPCKPPGYDHVVLCNPR